jgi:hypothetical protein
MPPNINSNHPQTMIASRVAYNSYHAMMFWPALSHGAHPLMLATSHPGHSYG